VFDEAGPVKSEYRKFKIKTVVGQSDVDCLAEVVERRLKHSEWAMPHVFLIDGGLPQVNRTKKVLDSFGVHTVIVGIAKGAERKRNDFFVLRADDIMKEWVRNNKQLLIKVRDEAHRFAITFNRAQRKIKL
ncbi:MAG: excinuclease ABC subunit C, partial [Candidatus Magasanikbacteria bacterium]|nr:excinuclease ABC subunit C [Candidatus Magasanikbacteria bacterium]